MLFSLFCMLVQMELVFASTCIGPESFPNSCMDIYNSGERENGNYRIAGTNGETWNVYCDFTSELGSAWTLVMSWSLQSRMVAAFHSKPLTTDASVNHLTPNWDVYRMSKDQMDFLKSKSSHWRSTCSFPKYGVDYRDYMRGNFDDFDILTFTGSPVTKSIEYINIRGYGEDQSACFWQRSDVMLHMGSQQCSNEFAIKGAKAGENNFGAYGGSFANPTFRCTSDNHATTQYWFGNYI